VSGGEITAALAGAGRAARRGGLEGERCATSLGSLFPPPRTEGRLTACPGCGVCSFS
jgi:hypothetical protein